MAGFLRSVLALLLVTAATDTPAAGAASSTKAIWGPARVDGVSQMPIYRDLGVGILEESIRWDATAATKPQHARDPADPAYAWPAALDDAVEQAKRNGIRISLMVLGAPGWANGGHDWRYSPRDPADYADFLTAIARRYPTIHLWMVWGEPTKAQNYQPLVADHGRPLRGAARAPAVTYATLLDRSYGRLKRLDPANRVIGGNSFTVGTVAPLYWIKALRLPDGRPPRMDLYGHNPFSARRPDPANPPLGRGLADFSDLDELSAAVARNLRRPGRPTPRLFLSEISLPTDHENFEFNFFLTRATQASWLRDMLRITRRSPQIATFGYLGLYDDAPRADGLQVERGLLETDGTRKPAYAAFKRG